MAEMDNLLGDAEAVNSGAAAAAAAAAAPAAAVGTTDAETGGGRRARKLVDGSKFTGRRPEIS
jgi:hypothetical protein